MVCFFLLSPGDRHGHRFTKSTVSCIPFHEPSTSHQVEVLRCSAVLLIVMQAYCHRAPHLQPIAWHGRFAGRSSWICKQNAFSFRPKVTMHKPVNIAGGMSVANDLRIQTCCKAILRREDLIRYHIRHHDRILSVYVGQSASAIITNSLGLTPFNDVRHD